MKNLTMAAFAATMVVTSAFAEEATVAPVTGPVLGGSIELKFKEDAAGDWGATNTIGASITMPGTAFASFNVESVDGATAQLDEWQLGTEVNDGTVSIGKQGDIWVAAEGEHTIHNPKMDESIQLNMGKAAVAVEFGDFTNDVSDIEAVAGALTFGAGSATLKGAIDYDLDASKYTLGARADVDAIGGVLTYAETTEKFAYEVDGTVYGITAYINGDEDDMTRNLGASYAYDFNGIELEPSVNYDMNAEDFAPAVTATFSF
jgi:hypothetical protein